MAVLEQPLIIAVTSGADIIITAQTWARGVTIQEDGSGAQAGLKVTFPNGNVKNIIPQQQPLVLGQVPPSNGPFVGQPASSVGGGGNAATAYCKVRSLGATTVVAVTEYN
jgi:hypothetical protein